MAAAIITKSVPALVGTAGLHERDCVIESSLAFYGIATFARFLYLALLLLVALPVHNLQRRKTAAPFSGFS